MHNILALVKNLLMHDKLIVNYSKAGLHDIFTIEGIAPNLFIITHENNFTKNPFCWKFTKIGALKEAEGTINGSTIINVIYIPNNAKKVDPRSQRGLKDHEIALIVNAVYDSVSNDAMKKFAIKPPESLRQIISGAVVNWLEENELKIDRTNM